MVWSSDPSSREKEDRQQALAISPATDSKVSERGKKKEGVEPERPRRQHRKNMQQQQEVKRSVRTDKDTFNEVLAYQAEEPAGKNDLKGLHTLKTHWVYSSQPRKTR